MNLAEQQYRFDAERKELLAKHDADKMRMRDQSKQELQVLLAAAKEQREQALADQLAMLTKKWGAFL
jgi:hypothetical protein